MKKLMTMLAAVATAFGLYAADSGFISGAGFDTGDSSGYTWTTSGTLAEGVFNSSYWADTTGLTVVEGTPLVGTSTDRPLQFIDKDRNYDGYLNVATTLGNPVGQYIKTSRNAQKLTGGLYFDALVKPTVFDEMPDMTVYNNAKVGVFVYQADEEAAKKLFVYADGLATNFYETTTTINDTQWYRLTIKMIDDIGTGKSGYVVFVDGTQVRCNAAKMDPTGLTPAAKEWNATGSLFLGLVDEGANTTVSEVLFDGKGDVDEIAFTTTAPDFAADKEFCKITGAANIKSFTVGGQIWTVGDAALDVEVINPIVVTAIVAADDYFCDYTTTNITGAVKGQTYTVGEAKKLGAYLQIGEGEEEPYESVAAAMAEVNKAGTTGDVTLKLNDASGAIMLNNENVDLVLDLAGRTITGADEDNTAAISVSVGKLRITDTSSPTVGQVIAGNATGTLAVDEGSGEVSIVAGNFKGEVFIMTGAISGGWFTEDPSLMVADGYVAKPLVDQGDFKWEVVVDTRITVTFADGVNCTVTAIDGDAADSTTTKKAEIGDTFQITYTATGDNLFIDSTTAKTLTVTVAAEGAQAAPAEAAAIAPVAVNSTTGVKYARLYDAFNVVADGQTITALRNVANPTNVMFTLDGEKTVTLDLGGFTLDALTADKNVPAGGYILDNGGYYFQVKGGATLTIQNGTMTRACPGGTVAKLYGASEVIVNGATIQNTNVGTGCIFNIAENGCKLTLTSGNILVAGHTDATKQAVRVQNGCTFVMNGGAVRVTDLETNLNAGYAIDIQPGATACTITAGEVDGVINNAAKLTGVIPGTSTATFDRDQTALCATGYKTELDTVSGRYKVVAASQPVPPEEPQPVPQGKDPQEYADELNEKGAAAKDLPAEVKALQPALTDDQVTAYKALFRFVPTSDGKAVELQLTDPAETVSNNVATATANIEVANIAGGTETEIEFTGIPGLWYQLNADDTLEGLAPVEEVICGTAGTVTFSEKVAPEDGDTARFFKISASAKPKITNQDPE